MMSSSNLTILIVAGVGMALIALLLLLGSDSETMSNGDVIPDTNTTVIPSASIQATHDSTLVVHAGFDRTVNGREKIRLSGEG